MFGKLEGVDTLLSDPATTSVRLVTNAERMVLRETQRTFVYFSLHGLTVDAILVNRLLPGEVSDVFFREWRTSQQAVVNEMEEYFSPVAVHRVPLFTHEVLGRERLEELARALYADSEDPSAVVRAGRPYHVREAGGPLGSAPRSAFRLEGGMGLFKKGDELVVEIGTMRRHIGLPTSMAALEPSRARLENGKLVVELREK